MMSPARSTVSPTTTSGLGYQYTVDQAGGKNTIAEGWEHGPTFDKGSRWDPTEIGAVVADLLAEARTPTPVYGT